MRKIIVLALLILTVGNTIIYSQDKIELINSDLSLNCPALEDTESLNLRGKFTWIMYDQIYSQNDLDDALSYNPDFILRGWFKWGGGAFDLNAKSLLIQTANKKNAIFGGGGTCSALFPNEVDSEKFQRIVDRNPNNEPEYFNNNPSGGYYHGDVQKKEYLDFLLGWIKNQIDAGVNTLFLDEVNGASSWRTGYSDLGMSEFNKFLVKKYIDTLGWAINDSRWNTELDIDLLNDCKDGTINTFDYRLYLKRKKYEEDPSIYNFPLKSEWGDPWNYKLTNTYINTRNQQAWEYLAKSIMHYSDSTKKLVYLSANGWNSFVDYQIEGVWNRWNVVNGKLDITQSYVQEWRKIKNYSCQVLSKDVPLIIFHDWASNMPFFSEISDDDRILWLRTYAAEIFASGAIFAWPVSNSGNNFKPSSSLKSIINKLILWYTENKNIYIKAKWLDPVLVDLKGQNKIIKTVFEVENSDTSHNRIVHLINKNFDINRNYIVKENFTIVVNSSGKPKAVWAISPDYKDVRPLLFSWENNNTSIVVDYLEAYTIVVLDYESDKYLYKSIIRNELINDINIFPDPAQNSITISYKSNINTDITFEIYNLPGMKILNYNYEIKSLDTRNYALDISNLNKGTYLLRVISNNNCRTLKFVKM